jgi:sulfur relay protein TusB/DsrH
MSEKNALLMLNQSPADCPLDRQLEVLGHAAGKGVLLMQDAVLFTVTGEAGRFKEAGAKVYALRQSVEARGLVDRVADEVELVDYGRAIDLIMDEYDMVI